MAKKEFVTFSPESGSNSTIVSVIVEKNEKSENRSTFLNIMSNGITETVQINQDKGEVNILLDWAKEVAIDGIPYESWAFPDIYEQMDGTKADTVYQVINGKLINTTCDVSNNLIFDFSERSCAFQNSFLSDWKLQDDNSVETVKSNGQIIFQRMLVVGNDFIIDGNLSKATLCVNDAILDRTNMGEMATIEKINTKLNTLGWEIKLTLDSLSNIISPIKINKLIEDATPIFISVIDTTNSSGNGINLVLS